MSSSTASCVTSSGNHHHRQNGIINNNRSNNNNGTPASTRSTITSSSGHHHQPTQACAACKYQRRKCNPDCMLASYFPADSQQNFLNAHRLFGVSNIIKIIKDMKPEERAEAMRSIIYQSNCRAADPVGGCYRMILDLQRQVEHEQAELALVLRQLAYCRAQSGQPINDLAAMHPNLFLDPTADVDVVDPSINVGGIVYPNDQFISMQQQEQQQQQCYDYFYYDNNIENINNNDSAGSNSNSVNNNGNGGGGLDVEVAQSGVSMLSLQQQCGDIDDVKPIIDDVFDQERQAFNLEGDINNEDCSRNIELFNCTSAKLDLKEEPNGGMEHLQEEHDLKEAASLFTLTNCNDTRS